ESVAAAPPVPRPPAAAPARGRGQELIMLVEDQSDVRGLVAALLRDLGYAVREATDGPAALEALRRDPAIDLLRTDLVMPQMSGIARAEAARRLRPDLRVLFIPGHSALPQDLPFDRDGGKAGFIAKPFQRDALGRSLRQLLDPPELAVAG